jgi:hypothetical protein
MPAVFKREFDYQMSEVFRLQYRFQTGRLDHLNNVDAISTKVKGIPRVPLAASGGAEFPEFVWLDS